MSQPFTQNVTDVEFHGANGNIILGGDSFAADRYTECRLSKITEDYVLSGIDKDTVPMTLNFSEDEYMPTVLPSLFPRLLVNGCQGIGVSVANTWLPHNLTDTINLIGKYVKFGRLDAEEYYPDFPTGGTIVNKDELHEINETGKGKVILEAAYKIEGREITFYEMPYQVYIEDTINKIKEQIEKGAITGIKDVLNKSDKKQIALVIECQRGVEPENVLEQLFRYTPLRSQYNANQNGILSKTPVLFNLQRAIDVYVEHNLQCIKNEYEYDLKKAEQRLEILEGMRIALTSIDKIIGIIKNAENGHAALSSLMSEFDFSEKQAKAILDMKLSKLTKLDGASIEKELAQKKEEVAACQDIVSNEESRKNLLLKKLRKMGKEYGTPRRTMVIQKENNKVESQERPVEDLVIGFNPLGYLQCIPVGQYKDNGLKTLSVTSEDYITLVSDKAMVYRIAVKDLKRCGCNDKGTAIGTLIDMASSESIVYVAGKGKKLLLFTTYDGIVKRVDISQFYGTARNKRGMAVFKEPEDVYISECPDGAIVTLRSRSRQISFNADSVRPSGKGTGGICGMTLDEGDYIEYVVVENENGFDGKIQKRGGKGIKVS